VDSRSTDPIAIVKTVIAALNRGDIEEVLRFCDREIELWAPGPDLSGQQIKGIDELRQVLERDEESWPDTWTSIDSIVGDGDCVAVELSTVATEQDISIVQPMAAFYTFKNGLIVAQRNYYDLRALERRLNG